MKNLIAILMLLTCFSFTGCSAITNSVLESAEEQVRLKWAEEWRPALEEEISNAAKQAEDRAWMAMIAQLENVESKVDGRLLEIGVRLEDFDTNADGRVTGNESIELLKGILAKNEDASDPLQWWEIMLTLAAAYLPLTAGKEVLKAKMNGIGNGHNKPT